MQATKKGIEINREELWALLSFCGEGEHHACVHFRVNASGKLEAASTTGRRYVEAIGKADGAATGQWPIDSDFLEKCRRALESSDERLLIELTSAGLKGAKIVDSTSGKMKCPIGWNREAATTQLTLPDIVALLDVPQDANHTGTWTAFDPEVLAPLNRVKVATDGCPITWYPPKMPEAPMHFEAVAKDGTSWRGAIVPEKVIGPGREADEPPKPDEGAPGRKDRQVTLDLAAKAKEPKPEKPADDGIVDDDYVPDGATEPPLATRKKNKKTPKPN